MPKILDSVPLIPETNSRKKRKIQPITYSKKLRSKIPRRKRLHLFPIVDKSSNQLFQDEETEFPAFPAPSCSSTCFPGDISCESSLISVGSDTSKKHRRSKENKAIGGSRVELERRITRSYYRQKKNLRSEPLIVEPFSQSDDRDFSRSDAFSKRTRSAKGASEADENEGKAASETNLSEISCIKLFSQDNSKQKIRSCKEDENSLQTEENIVSAATLSEISSIEPFFQEISKQKIRSSKEDENSLQTKENAVSAATLSEISCIEPFFQENSKPKIRSCEEDENSLQTQENAVSTIEFSKLSPANTLNFNQKRANSEINFIFSQSPIDLACSEQLSNEDDVSDYSSCQEMTLSELESEIFPKNSDGDYIDYSQQSISSFFDESCDDFSERSDRNSNSSECFSLISQYLELFSISKFKPSHGNDEEEEEDYSDEFTMLRFEDEEYEESYKRFRSRERKQVFLHDYGKEYCLTTEYGGLVVQQRQLMVNWILEHSRVHDLQRETLFLSVSLLDRFLSRGFFTSKKNLQLLGIACCTLATRIEENQPLNCVRQKMFQVCSNVYRRCEVVAMEWVVQEVLNFQCFMPTTYNFLWFYLKAARADAEVENRTNYLALLSLLNDQSLCFWPSTVAAGLVILASLESNRDSSCQSVMETHVRTKDDDLPECIQSLEWLMKYVY